MFNVLLSADGEPLTLQSLCSDIGLDPSTQSIHAKTVLFRLAAKLLCTEQSAYRIKCVDDSEIFVTQAIDREATE